MGSAEPDTAVRPHRGGGGWVAVAVLAAATALTLITAGQRYAAALVADERVGAAALLIPPAAAWYFWALWCPVIFRLGRRFPLASRRWPWTLPVHLVVGSLLAVAHTAVVVWGARAFAVNSEIQGTPYGVMLRAYLLFQFQLELPTYFAIVGAQAAFDYYRRYRERSAAAAELTAELARAQLLALKMQLHPHFLFNTLHAVGVLVESDPRAARRVLAVLGDLLRLTLADAATQEVSLQRELQLLRLYLEIEQTRFPDRLRVAFEVDDAALNARVPNFILQPLVENAVRYGVAPRSEPGVIEIRAQRLDGAVRLEIWNDGPPLCRGSNGAVVEGVGLATTRQRLHKLYGDAASLTMADGEGGGVRVCVTIPAEDERGEGGAAA